MIKMRSILILLLVTCAMAQNLLSQPKARKLWHQPNTVVTPITIDKLLGSTNTTTNTSSTNTTTGSNSTTN